PLAGIGDLVERLRRTAQKSEVVLGYAEPRRRFAARRLLAVQAVTDSDEVGVFVERELHRAAGALSRVFPRHDQSPFTPRYLQPAVPAVSSARGGLPHVRTPLPTSARREAPELSPSTMAGFAP